MSDLLYIDHYCNALTSNCLVLQYNNVIMTATSTVSSGFFFFEET